MISFQAADANNLYVQVLSTLLARGFGAAPRGMATSETTGAVINLSNARRCLVTLPARKLNYHFAVAEWLWISTGREDVASLEPYCKEIGKFSDDGLTFFGSYGIPWLAQREYLLEKLIADHDTRQAVMTIWRPSPPPTKDVPCTVAFQFLRREGALNLVATMRSSDAWLGLPYDLHNFGRLQAELAAELKLAPGWLQLQAGSLHLYDRNRVRAQEVVDVDVREWGSAPPQPDLPGFVPRGLGNFLKEGPSFPHREQHPWNLYLQVIRNRFTRTSATLNLGNPFYELIKHPEDL